MIRSSSLLSLAAAAFLAVPVAAHAGDAGQAWIEQLRTPPAPAADAAAVAAPSDPAAAFIARFQGPVQGPAPVLGASVDRTPAEDFVARLEGMPAYRGTVTVGATRLRAVALGE